MGNCCTGSPTTDHPFDPDRLSLPPPQTAFSDSSPALHSVGADQTIDMTSSFMSGMGGVDTIDSVIERQPDVLIHMADREGKSSLHVYC